MQRVHLLKSLSCMVLVDFKAFYYLFIRVYVFRFGNPIAVDQLLLMHRMLRSTRRKAQCPEG